MNKAICGSKESAAPHDELETWKETVLVPTLSRYSPNDIYNGDETALFYKSLPHRTYCFDGDKPAGSAKCKDRLTLLIITNMDGSDHRKLSVIGKSKTPRCLQKYKMQVKDMSVDWYASKNAWMTGEIHHQIMSKLNNEMRLSNRHILYVCDNASSHQVRDYSHIKFLMLPPNATSIMQPLDQGIILSAKRRYKKKLAERYLACVENNKDANSLLKALDIVQATNMIAASWRETSSTIIQNCFRKAGFKHHAVDPASEIQEDPLPAPAPDVWNRVQRWLGDVQFDEFAASEPEAGTAQPMSDQDIVNIVLTENDVQEESDDESEEEIPSTSAIKTSVEFLAMIDQQKAFLKRNELPTEIVEQLEAQVVAVQVSLCSKQKQMQDYFQSSPRAPTPSKESRAHTPTKEGRAPTPIKDVSFKTVADVTKDVSLVDLLDMDDMELESLDTTIASVAASALMKETPTRFSTPKRPRPLGSEPRPSTSMGTGSQPPPKKLKLGLSRPIPKTFKLHHIVDKVMNMSSGSSSVCTSSDSDAESLSSQE